MKNKNASKLFFALILLCHMASVSLAADTAKKKSGGGGVQEEAAELEEQFKGTSFLQIDALDVPVELTRIDEQLKQNAIDVIITSKTHTPVFAQKQPNGYSESYKKFNGLKIQIVPIPNEQDFYSLTLNYYNWTTRKYDKSLRKRISKYNVLNEMRFGVYEILLGEDFVRKNYDKLEKLNFQRIQAIRKLAEEKERDSRKKKKADAKKQKALEEKEEALEKKKNNAQNKLDRGDEKDPNSKGKRTPPSNPEEVGKKTTNNLDPEIDDSETSSAPSVKAPEVEPDFTKPKTKKSTVNEIEEETKDNKEKITDDVKTPEKPRVIEKESRPPSPPELPDPIIPPRVVEKTPKITNDAYAYANFFEDSTLAQGLVRTTTYLKYLSAGATYVHMSSDEEREQGYRISIKVGVPVKKDDYQFPVYRSIETEFIRGKIYKNLQGIVGLDYAPLYFLGLPKFNEGFQIYENEFYCLKLGVAITPDMLKRLFTFKLLFYKSLLSKSSEKQDFSETSASLSAFVDYVPGHGFELIYQKRLFGGAFKVETEHYSFSYIYKFKE